jgi:hypothetical protein
LGENFTGAVWISSSWDMANSGSWVLLSSSVIYAGVSTVSGTIVSSVDCSIDSGAEVSS